MKTTLELRAASAKKIDIASQLAAAAAHVADLAIVQAEMQAKELEAVKQLNDVFAENFIANCHAYGLEESDLGRLYVYNDMDCKIIGAKPRNNNYKIRCLRFDGEIIYARASEVARQLHPQIIVTCCPLKPEQATIIDGKENESQAAN